jgi:DNA-binding NarL/FixJ family response regulator
MEKKLMVLIVDDNLLFIERMIRMISDLSNVSEVCVAQDHNTAYQIMNERQPDIVLLDINLPGKNGIEILKKIKSNGNTNKVIMITNHADDYYREICKGLGADYFLDKSNDFAKVPEIIKELEFNY